MRRWRRKNMALGLKPVEIVEKKNYPLLVISPHWERVFLKNLADVQNGFAFSSKLFTKNKGMPLIRIRDISNNKTENYYYGEYDQDVIVNKGDILIGMDGDFNVSIWKGKPGLLNQRVCRIRPRSEKYSEKFLFICLQPYLNAINAETSSVTVKHLSSRTVEDIPLPMPPLPEQHCIVAKIEELFSELDNGISNLKKVREQLKTYRQAVLKYAFEGKLTQEWRIQQRRAGNPPEPAEKLLEQIKLEREKHYKKQVENWEKACEKAKKEGQKKPARPKKPKKLTPLTEKELAELPELPKGWGWFFISEVSIQVTDGDHNPPKRIKSGIPHLTAKNIQNNKISFDGCTYISDKDFQTVKKRYEPQESDLIVTCVGTVGRTAIVPKGIKFSADRNLAVIRFSDNGISSKFIEYFLNTSYSQYKIKTSSGSTAQPHFYLSDIRKFPVPLSCVEEQDIIIEEIESRLSVCDKLEQAIEDSLKKAEALRQSILKKAFSGELTKDWREKHPELISGENSAEKLLEKIKADKALFGAGQKKLRSKKTKKK
jgi:type I restriction enzyme S subunit